MVIMAVVDIVPHVTTVATATGTMTGHTTTGVIMKGATSTRAVTMTVDIAIMVRAIVTTTAGKR